MDAIMRWYSPRNLAVLLLLAVLSTPVGLAADLDGRPDATNEGVLAATATPAGSPPAMMGPHTDRSPSDFEFDAAPAKGSSLSYAPAVEWTAAAEQEVAFACPTGNEETLGGFDDVNVVVLRQNCPFRIIDEADLLGSPQIALRQDDPREVAFFSLHGAASADGPTPRSRDPGAQIGSLSHTTFTSGDAGWTWSDNPHGDEGFGEAGDGIISRDGNLFVSSVFARSLGRDNAGLNLFDYHFVLYKENDVNSRMSYKGHSVPAREPGNTIEEVNLVLVTPPSMIENQTEYEQYLDDKKERERFQNESQKPSGENDIGNYTIPRGAEDFSDDIIAAVWHETAYDWRNASTGKSSWIDVAWTDASSRDDWHHLKDNQLIGPCRDASNPVAFNGRVYVACVVDAGYTARRGARVGDMDIWQIDVENGRKAYVDTVPQMQDGRPRLAVNDHGRFVITSIKEIGAEEPFTVVRAEMSFGWYGRRWEAIKNLGPELHEIWSLPVRTARISEMVLTNDADMVWMTYAERTNTTVRNPEVNPNGPDPAGAQEYHKALAVFESCTPSALVLMDLNVGLARHPFEDGLVNDVTGVFDDLHDGMVVGRQGGNPAGTEIVVFAYGDHGVIQFGAIDAASVRNELCSSMPPPPVFFSPVPPIATPLLLNTGVSLGTGLAAGLPAALGLGSLLIAKRRVALAAAVKAKK